MDLFVVGDRPVVEVAAHNARIIYLDADTFRYEELRML